MKKSTVFTAAQLCVLSYQYANIFDDESDVQAIAEEKNDRLFLAIRGTTNYIDWWRNLQVYKMTYPWEHDYQGDVRLHSGFANGYKSIREKVLKWAGKSNLPVTVTGHSQGGAIATIAAVDIQYNTQKEVSCINFAGPAAGNEAFKESAAHRISSATYLNILDIVPWLLPQNSHISRLTCNPRLYINPHSVKNYLHAVSNY